MGPGGIPVPALIPAALVLIPGTHWRVDAGAPISGDEVAALTTVAAALPESWRALAVGVRAEGRPGPYEDAAHPLVRVHEHGGTGEITLAAGPLPADGVPELQRQWVHALAHVVDARAHWSRDRRWRAISGWSTGWAGVLRPVAAERTSDAFARPAGRLDPAEDLATFAEDFFLPRPVGVADVDASPRCRMPSKWRYFAERTGRDPGEPCAAPAWDEVAAIELIHVAATASSASIAGHMLVALRYRPDADGNTRIVAYGLVADTTGVPEGTLRYTLLGLAGGFSSRVITEPLEATLLRYTEVEDRDVRRYRLDLDAAQQARFLARLDELRQGWDRPYLFLGRNCVELPVELLAAALGDFQPPFPRMPDVVLGMLARRGLVTEIAQERPQELGIGGRAIVASRLRRAAGRELRDATTDVPLRSAVRAALRGARDPDPTARARAYTTLGAVAGALDVPERTLPAVSRYLGWSDVVEQAATLPDRRDGRLPHNAAIEGLRAAKGSALRAAAVVGVPASQLPTGQAEVMHALAEDRVGASAHTSFRAMEALPTVVWDGSAAAYGVTVRTALYDARLGAARRFPLAEGMEIAALRSTLQVGLAPAGWLRGRSCLLDVRYIPDADRAVHPGWSATLADVGYRGAVPFVVTTGAFEPPGLDATWLAARGLLDLAHTRHFGSYVGLSLGVALESEVSAPYGARAPGEWVQVAAPVGIAGQVGSTREALTFVRGTADWRPILRGDGAAWTETRATLDGGVRLGAVGGADVGLSIEAAGRWGAVREESVGLGVRVERL